MDGYRNRFTAGDSGGLDHPLKSIGPEVKKSVLFQEWTKQSHHGLPFFLQESIERDSAILVAGHTKCQSG